VIVNNSIWLTVAGTGGSRGSSDAGPLHLWLTSWGVEMVAKVDLHPILSAALWGKEELLFLSSF